MSVSNIEEGIDYLISHVNTVVNIITNKYYLMILKFLEGSWKTKNQANI